MFYKDRYYLLYILLGVVTVGTLAAVKGNYAFLWYIEKPLQFIQLVFISSVAEEVLFRGIAQPLLKKKLTFWWANIITSLLFCLLHLFVLRVEWALATFFPSLVFGEVKERYKTLWAPISLHILYNLFYFLIYEF